jgi:hypothetical protein
MNIFKYLNVIDVSPHLLHSRPQKSPLNTVVYRRTDIKENSRASSWTVLNAAFLMATSQCNRDETGPSAWVFAALDFATIMRPSPRK